MAFIGILLENLAELKLRVGNTTDTTLASILGIDYPTIEGNVTYRWHNTSLAVPDDFEIVCPTSRIGMAGRWFRIDNAQLPQANSDWSATSGVAKILNKPTTLSGYGITDVYSKIESDGKYLTSFTESDPTVGSHIKAITTTNISNWNNAFSWGDHNLMGYLTENSFSNLTNKSGNISQWSNNVGYITGVTSGQITSALGYAPYNSTNPNNYITLSSVTWSNIPDKPTIPTNTNQLVNGAGFITGITSSNVSTALGYVPYNSTNPNGFITGVTSGQISTALGYTPYNSSNPSGFITGITAAQISTALGYTPASAVTTSYNNAPSRSVTTSGTSYQISATRNSRVSYTVTLTTAVSLLNLNSGAQVSLEISPNNSTWTTINSAGLTRTLSVAITIGLNDSQVVNIQGEIPAGYFVRLRSTLSGGGTATFTSGQEVMY